MGVIQYGFSTISMRDGAGVCVCACELNCKGVSPRIIKHNANDKWRGYFSHFDLSISVFSMRQNLLFYEFNSLFWQWSGWVGVSFYSVISALYIIISLVWLALLLLLFVASVAIPVCCNYYSRLVLVLELAIFIASIWHWKTFRWMQLQSKIFVSMVSMLLQHLWALPYLYSIDIWMSVYSLFCRRCRRQCHHCRCCCCCCCFNSIENDMFLINFMIIKIFAEVLFMQIALIVRINGWWVWTLWCVCDSVLNYS